MDLNDLFGAMQAEEVWRQHLPPSPLAGAQPQEKPGYPQGQLPPPMETLGHDWPAALYPDQALQLQQQQQQLLQHLQQHVPQVPIAQDYLGQFGYLAALQEPNLHGFPAGAPGTAVWPQQVQLHQEDDSGLKQDSSRSVLL